MRVINNIFKNLGETNRDASQNPDMNYDSEVEKKEVAHMKQDVKNIKKEGVTSLPKSNVI